MGTMMTHPKQYTAYTLLNAIHTKQPFKTIKKIYYDLSADEKLKCVDAIYGDSDDTAAILAASHDDYKLMDFLLVNKFDIRQTNFYNQNALHIAVTKNRVDYVKILCINDNFLTKIKDHCGNTPLDYYDDLIHSIEIKRLLTTFSQNNIVSRVY
jgi:ankyrin repeat protein